MHKLEHRLKRIVGVFSLCLSMQQSVAQNIPTEIANKIVSVEMLNATPAQVLDSISAQTGLKFSYRISVWEGIKKISVQEKEVPLKSVLHKVLTNNRINWTFISPDIIVLRKSNLISSNNYHYNGFIVDSLTGEKLAGAHVYYHTEQKSFHTNHEGFYALQSIYDTVVLRVSYIGYETKYIKIGWKKGLQAHITLNPLVFLTPATVTYSSTSQSMSGETGREIRLKSWQITELSPLFGESDVFRTLQLLPGIQSVGEGTPGLYVRGGSPDQNLVLLDGTPLYNPVHIFGFYSVFNPGIVKNVNMRKGPFPAQYGGRLSSVIDVLTKDGNKNKFGGDVGVGLIGSRISLEGPVNKSSKTTFLVSGRRSQIDLLLSPFFDANLSTQNAGFLSAYYYYDLNAKIVHRPNAQNKFTLSAYLGQDKVALNNSFKLDNTQRSVTETDRQEFGWGNSMIAAKWDRVIKDKAMLKTSVWFTSYNFGNRSRYTFSNKAAQDTSELFYDYSYNSRIYDLGLRSEINYYPSNKWNIIAGFQSINHNFQPGVSSVSGNLPNLESVKTISKINTGIENAVFLENEWNINKKTELYAGVHLAHFNVQNTNYITPQPRISITHNFMRKWNLTAGYAHMQQFMHLLTNSSIGIPNDLWILSSQNLAPQLNKQSNINLKFNEKKWAAGVDFFHKNMENVIEYKDGANFLRVTDDWENRITTGIGTAIGMEFFAEKKVGNFIGWLGYCLSRNTRQFDDINEGRPFLFRYNRTHDLSGSLSYQLKQSHLLSVNFVYASGTPITLPEQIYSGVQIDGPFVDIFVQGNRNNYILPDYHRVDLNYSNFKTNKFGMRIWSFGLYNAYNRQNPFFITPAYNDLGERILRQVSLFPIIPSVTYRQQF
jgi:hypothetical protein